MTVLPVMSAIDPEGVLQSLTLDDKIRLLSGDDMWHTAPVPEAGVPRVRVCDGPNGVRGTAWINAHPASCFPCGLGLGASFDLDLARRVGIALGTECRARGTHCLLGPTIGIPRNPLGGRGFESFSEDPLHSGLLARALIEGVQSQRVMTSPKHFVCNEQEAFRRSTNSVVDERTLHEIYLEPFRIICQSRPATIMTAYNQVNGLHASEHPELLRHILRKDFGFEGMIMSDWGGTYSCKESIRASLDLEMPGPSMMRGAMIERYVLSGKLAVADVDDCVLRVLRFVQRAQQSAIPFEAKEGTVDTPKLRALLRESASAGVVLLKNDNAMLPLVAKHGSRVAIIGQNANVACHAGGGSAHVIPTYAFTPLEAIREVVEAAGGSVEHALGSAGHRWQPELTPYIEAGGIQGMLVEFSDTCLWRETTKPLHSMHIAGSKPFFVDGIPKTVPTRGYIQLTATFTPHVGGIWDFGLAVAGQAQLYLDDLLVVDHTKDQQPSVLFFNTGSEERIGMASVEAGRSYKVQVRFSNFEQIDSMSPYAGRRGGVRLGGQPRASPQELRAEAIELSKRSDVTILVVGTNSEWESESYDRDDLHLPPGSDELIRAILDAQPNTVVVNQSGMPVDMPWIAQAPAVVQAFFGGNECGRGIADVLFGAVEPRGRLPITWPVSYADVPGQDTFGGSEPTIYAEGLQVGYRCQGAPLFPFGHGLTYTHFVFSGLSLEHEVEHRVSLSFTVKNAGGRVGTAIPQVYVISALGEIKLGGFDSRMIESGQETTIRIQLTHESFSVYDATTKKWMIFKGEYEIKVGDSASSFKLTTRHEIKQAWSWKGQSQPVVL